MLARAITHALVGLEPRRVEVEAHVHKGLPGFTIVGLADRACQEARERVRSGVAAAELSWPGVRITVNLAPAELKKEGSGFDLPIALAVLAASRQIPPESLESHAAVGELALDGRVRRVGGVLAVAEGATRCGIDKLLCAAESCAEAALAGIEFGDLYRGRGSVERAFGRLKNEAGLAPLRVRGIEKVALHADLCILATLAQALVRARAVPLAA